ncbi:MAG: diacylglycerol kinase family lipid kinase [Clostridia bacterium]|nr:diacylglycerol kinase family lipid kinase [Clostridia bacterium]
MRPFFIVNPVAGGGACEERFARVKQYLSDRCVEFGWVMTERADQSAELAENAYSAGERFIVAVGGDGTVNEVASALYNKKDAVMGICAFGTGNDFVRVLQLPTEPEQAAETLVSGEPTAVDIGLVGSKPFINVAGFGFDVDVVINTEKYKARFHGMIPYLLGIVKSLLHLRTVKVKLTADDRELEREVTICAIGNGSHFGGGMKALPLASATDGLLDVCVISKIRLPRFLVLLPSFIKGKHLGKKCVEYFRAAKVEIEGPRTPMQLDGELGEYCPASVRVVPACLRVMLPKDRRLATEG